MRIKGKDLIKLGIACYLGLTAVYILSLCYIWLGYGIDAPLEDWYSWNVLVDIGTIIRDIFDLILTGDYNAGLYRAFGIMEDSNLLEPIYFIHQNILQ